MPVISSVLVGSRSSIFGNKMSEHDEDDTMNEDGAAVFNSSWFPGSDSKYGHRTNLSLSLSLSHVIMFGVQG